jgi:hypothetical protein
VFSGEIPLGLRDVPPPIITTYHDRKEDHPFERQRLDHRHEAWFGVTTLTYDLRRPADSFPILDLDKEEAVTAVQCSSPGTVVLAHPQDADVPLLEGSILSIGKEWGCSLPKSSEENGDGETAFVSEVTYFQVWHETRTATGSILSGERTSLHEMFSHGSVEYDFTPSQELESFLRNRPDSPHNTTTRRSLLFEYETDLFSNNYDWNYDPQTGGSQTTKIDLVPNLLVCDDCFVHLGVGLTFRATFGYSSVSEVSLVLHGDFAMKFFTEKPPGARSGYLYNSLVDLTPRMYLPTIVVPLGTFVDLRISPSVKMSVEASLSYDVQGEFAGPGVTASANLRVGAQYTDHNQFEIIHSSGLRYYYREPDFSQLESVQLKGTIGLRLRVYFSTSVESSLIDLDTLVTATLTPELVLDARWPAVNPACGPQDIEAVINCRLRARGYLGAIDLDSAADVSNVLGRSFQKTTTLISTPFPGFPKCAPGPSLPVPLYRWAGSPWGACNNVCQATRTSWCEDEAIPGQPVDPSLCAWMPAFLTSRNCDGDDCVPTRVTIRSVSSGTCVGSTGDPTAPLSIGPCDVSSSIDMVQWDLTVQPSGETWRVQSPFTNKCIAFIESLGVLHTTSCVPDARTQMFGFIGDGQITAAFSDGSQKCVQNNGLVVDCDGSDAQLFAVSRIGNFIVRESAGDSQDVFGSYIAVSPRGTRFSLQIAHGGVCLGELDGVVDFLPCDDEPDQRWRIRGTQFQLESTGTCLSVAANTLHMALVECSTSPDQVFSVVDPMFRSASISNPGPLSGANFTFEVGGSGRPRKVHAIISLANIHEFRLSASLESPDGKKVTLFDDFSGNARDVPQMTFSSNDGFPTIGSYVGTYGQSGVESIAENHRGFSPEEGSFGSFLETGANGTWTLHFTDSSPPPSTGEVIGWGDAPWGEFTTGTSLNFHTYPTTTWWQRGDRYGPCSLACVQFLDYSCYTSDGHYSSDEACVQRKPSVTRACSGQDCTVGWELDPSVAQTCSDDTCAFPSPYICRNSAGADLADEVCEQAGVTRLPNNASAACESDVCVASYGWSEWDDCAERGPDLCLQSRDAVCQVASSVSGEVWAVDAQLCEQSSAGLVAPDAPSETRVCTTGPCEAGPTQGVVPPTTAAVLSGSSISYDHTFLYMFCCGYWLSFFMNFNNNN